MAILQDINISNTFEHGKTLKRIVASDDACRKEVGRNQL